MPTTTTGNTDGMPELDSLVTALQEAVAKGNIEQAKDMAENLARHQAKLSINLISFGNVSSPNNCFSLEVQLESAFQDKVPHAPVPLQASAGMTIYGLKVKMAILYNIPMQCQKWIIGKKIPRDNETLGRLSITKATKVYMFVLEPKTQKLDRGDTSTELQNLQKFHDALLQRGLNPDLAMSPKEYSNYLHTQRDRGYQHRSQSRGRNYIELDSSVENEGTPRSPDMTLPSPDDGDSPGTMPRYPLPRRAFEDEPPHNRPQPGERSTLGNRRPAPQLPLRTNLPQGQEFRRAPPPVVKPNAVDVGWSCELCTFVNPPIIPACRTCLGNRPEGYKVPPPSSYIMDKDEERIFLEMQQNEMLLEEWEEEEKKEEQRQASVNLAQMIQVAEQDLVTNVEPFECPVCFTEVEPNQGVTLRECLHQLCRECLENHINICNEPEIKCPYTDGGNDCEQVIPDREIKQIISGEDYDRYLQRSVNRAEAAAADSFHCKSPDCVGLCFYDDEINFFDCDVCGHQNCLTCKAIHEDQNCKQYQEDLVIKAGNDDAAKKTHEALQEMVRSGEAMNCPQCGIVIQKKSGCDWMQCSVCKVEICWVTKGPRWGPKGNGDSTGGCKCRVNGKCHPRCGNCH